MNGMVARETYSSPYGPPVPPLWDLFEVGRKLVSLEYYGDMESDLPHSAIVRQETWSQ